MATEMHNFAVICHTENCGNENIAINIESEDLKPIVVCGPCGQPVTDIESTD